MKTHTYNIPICKDINLKLNVYSKEEGEIKEN